MFATDIQTQRYIVQTCYSIVFLTTSVLEAILSNSLK